LAPICGIIEPVAVGQSVGFVKRNLSYMNSKKGGAGMLDEHVRSSVVSKPIEVFWKAAFANSEYSPLFTKMQSCGPIRVKELNPS
jgi:hypothetical protein